MFDYKTILVETRTAAGLVTLNRLERMNALNNELAQALRAFDADAKIKAIVITGDARASTATATTAYWRRTHRCAPPSPRWRPCPCPCRHRHRPPARPTRYRPAGRICVPASP